MGNKVKIWSFNSSKQPILTVMLDHQDPAKAKQAGSGMSPAGGARDVEGGPTDMQWLTRSDLDGLAPERPKLPDIVQQAIRTAGEDVPEVTQASRSCINDLVVGVVSGCKGSWPWLSVVWSFVQMVVCLPLRVTYR
jgi:hypothetical protein